MEPSYSVVADWLSKFHTWPAFIQMLWLVVPLAALLGTTWIVMRGLRDIAAVLRGRGEATLRGIRWTGPLPVDRGGRLLLADDDARMAASPHAALSDEPRDHRARLRHRPRPADLMALADTMTATRLPIFPDARRRHRVRGVLRNPCA